MEKKYPNHRIIEDIGSGLNMKRKGLKELIELAIEGKVKEVVITYKDRLTRFGYELIEWLIEKYSDGTIKVINKNEEETPEEEITKDIIQIMNVYVAKINGRRKNKTKK
jgi:predicted site-specific integrase-resolvase